LSLRESNGRYVLTRSPQWILDTKGESRGIAIGWRPCRCGVITWFLCNVKFGDCFVPDFAVFLLYYTSSLTYVLHTYITYTYITYLLTP